MHYEIGVHFLEHFMQRTNWYVITGAPCFGKTAVICKLEQLGYQVVHEVARSYIDKELNKGQSIARGKADADVTIPCILEPELTDKASRKNWIRLIQKIYSIESL